MLYEVITEGQGNRTDREDGEVEEENLHPLRELNGDTVAFADSRRLEHGSVPLHLPVERTKGIGSAFENDSYNFV